MFLTNILVKWYINKKISKPSHIKRTIFIMKPQKKYNIKENLGKANEYWNDWKLQIRWNKLEWVDPKKCNMKINPFTTS